MLGAAELAGRTPGGEVGRVVALSCLNHVPRLLRYLAVAVLLPIVAALEMGAVTTRDDAAARALSR